METLTRCSFRFPGFKHSSSLPFIVYFQGVRAFDFGYWLANSTSKLVFRAIGIQSGLNRILPFRLGELTLPIWLSPNTTLTTTQILYSLLWVRIIDFSLILAIGLMGIGFYLQTQDIFAGVVFIFIAIVVLIGLIFIQPNRLGSFHCQLPRHHSTHNLGQSTPRS